MYANSSVCNDGWVISIEYVLHCYVDINYIGYSYSGTDNYLKDTVTVGPITI